MGVGAGVAGVGACPVSCLLNLDYYMEEYALMIPSQMNCWNEAAVVAGCDPNADDDCLCGPFFDAVTSCTAAMCNMGENLGMLCWILRI